ncbi:MAG TPA: MFS transporter [bacterium]|nr:MFS transporter [bacterium]
MASATSARAADARRAMRILILATLQQAGLTTIRFGLPVLAPFWREALAVSLPQVGVLLGAFDFGALLLFVPIGLLVDRWGEPAVLTAGALFTAAMAALVADAHHFATLALLLALAGLGYGTGQTAGTKAVASAFAPRARGIAMGIRQSGLPLGGMFAALLIPVLAGAFGWRAGLLGAAGVCGFTGLLCAVGLRGAAGAADEDDEGGPHRGRLGARLIRILADPGIRRTAIVAMVLVIGQFCYQGYLPLYMVDRFGWSKHAAAALLLAVHGGGIAGRLGWGWLSDRVLGGLRTPALAWCAALCAVFPLALAALPRPVPVAAAAAVACVGGLLLLGWNGLFSTLVLEHARAHDAGAAMGVSMTMLYAVTFITPPIFGWVVERTSYATAWTTLAVLLAVGYAVARRVPEP